MTQEVAPSSAAALPEEWFDRSQRAFSDIRYKLERRQRELDVQEQELEGRMRDLLARGEKLRDAFQAAEEASQDLMARTHHLREEEQALGAAREDFASRRADLERREAALADADRGLREREASIAGSQRDLARMREDQQTALASARQVLATRLRDLDEGVRAIDPQPAATVATDALPRLLQLKAEFESVMARLRSREGEAERLLRQATERVAAVDRIERDVREQEDRLAGMRAEIVNAREALLTVDDVLSRMPYEVVDDFTKSASFDAYERALRALKRFESPAKKG